MNFLVGIEAIIILILPFVAFHGYDPMIGYLHSYDEDRAALVFDLMEPLRPVVDRVVLDLVRYQTFKPADFTIRKDGVCRLNPEMARHVIGLIDRQLFGARIHHAATRGLQHRSIQLYLKSPDVRPHPLLGVPF
jgi:CRISPR/Cas system-associated endonuclease Cas1